MDGNTTNTSELADRLITLIRKTRALDTKQDWLYLNQLWYEYESREAFQEIVSEFLTTIVPWTPNHVLLTLEGTASTMGLVPILSTVASDLNCRLAIWREIVPPSISGSWFFPSQLDENLHCVILQDVLSKGSLITRVIEDLQYVKWKVEALVSVVQVDKNSRYIDEVISDFRKHSLCASDFQLHSLVSLSSL